MTDLDEKKADWQWRSAASVNPLQRRRLRKRVLLLLCWAQSSAFNLESKHAKSPADAEKWSSSIWFILTAFSLSAVSLTFPPPGWYLMLSMEPILERTFFRSGVGALMEREFLGARGTGGFFSSGVCLGTGGLVMTRRRCEASPLVEAAGVAGVVLEMGRRAGGRRRYVYGYYYLRTF